MAARISITGPDHRTLSRVAMIGLVFMALLPSCALLAVTIADDKVARSE